MKKLLVLFLMAFTLNAVAQTAPKIDLQKKWGAVIQAIAMVESQGQPRQVSKNGLYVGYLQISEILVRECNRIVGYKKYTYADRYDKQKSIDMFIDYQPPTTAYPVGATKLFPFLKKCMRTASF